MLHQLSLLQDAALIAKAGKLSVGDVEQDSKKGVGCCPIKMRLEESDF